VQHENFSFFTCNTLTTSTTSPYKASKTLLKILSYNWLLLEYTLIYTNERLSADNSTRGFFLNFYNPYF